MKHTVYLGLGSNVGDRIKFLAAAIRGIADAPLTVVDDISSVYETEPVGEIPQRDFLNLCVSVRTEMDVQEFHSLMKTLEREIGRHKTTRWGPREIDIDVLLFDRLIVQTDNLMIPHKEMVNRKFVLQPLCEIAPVVVHPVFGKTVQELLSETNDTHTVKRSDSFTSQLLLLINDSITNPTI